MCRSSVRFVIYTLVIARFDLAAARTVLTADLHDERNRAISTFTRPVTLAASPNIVFWLVAFATRSSCCRRNI